MDETTGDIYAYFTDVDSSQWIQVNGVGAVGAGGVDLSSVDQDIIPATNEQIDLGSSAKKFKDLHLSGTTLNIGSQTIKATATGIEVPELKIGTGTNTVKLTAGSDGKLTTTETDSQGNTGAASPAAGGSAVYADMAGLVAATGMAAGDQALVTALNKVFMYTCLLYTSDAADE